MNYEYIKEFNKREKCIDCEKEIRVNEFKYARFCFCKLCDYCYSSNNNTTKKIMCKCESIEYQIKDFTYSFPFEKEHKLLQKSYLLTLKDFNDDRNKYNDYLKEIEDLLELGKTLYLNNKENDFYNKINNKKVRESDFNNNLKKQILNDLNEMDNKTYHPDFYLNDIDSFINALSSKNTVEEDIVMNAKRELKLPQYIETNRMDKKEVNISKVKKSGGYDNFKVLSFYKRYNLAGI